MPTMRFPHLLALSSCGMNETAPRWWQGQAWLLWVLATLVVTASPCLHHESSQVNPDHLQAGCRAGCRVRCQGRCRAIQDTGVVPVHLAVTVLWAGVPFLQKPISPADTDMPLRNDTGSPSSATSSVLAADQRAHQHPVCPHAQCQADTLHRASSYSAASRALRPCLFALHRDGHLHAEFFLSNVCGARYF